MLRFNRILLVTLFSLLIIGNGVWAATGGSDTFSSIEEHFQKAKNDYVKKNLNAAADEIHKGAIYVKKEAETASDKGKEALLKSYDELELLAMDVRKGTVTSIKRLESSFAHAYHALANNAHLKSAEAWSRKEISNPGSYLDKTTRYLEKGFTWANQKKETVTEEVIKKSKDLAQKIKRGTGWVSSEVEKGLKETGSEIEKLGKMISSP
jgi:hypothetical protein